MQRTARARELFPSQSTLACWCPTHFSIEEQYSCYFESLNCQIYCCCPNIGFTNEITCFLNCDSSDWTSRESVVDFLGVISLICLQESSTQRLYVIWRMSWQANNRNPIISYQTCHQMCLFESILIRNNHAMLCSKVFPSFIFWGRQALVEHISKKLT